MFVLTYFIIKNDNHVANISNIFIQILTLKLFNSIEILHSKIYEIFSAIPETRFLFTL